MKLLFCLSIAVLVYLALGPTLGFTNHTALSIPLLGSFGTFTWKGMMATVTFVFMSGKR